MFAESRETSKFEYSIFRTRAPGILKSIRPLPWSSKSCAVGSTYLPFKFVSSVRHVVLALVRGMSILRTVEQTLQTLDPVKVRGHIDVVR